MKSYPTTRHARRAWLDRMTRMYPERVEGLRRLGTMVGDTSAKPGVLEDYRGRLRELDFLREALTTSTLLSEEARHDGPTDTVLLGHAVEFEDGEIICVGGWCERDNNGSAIIPYCEFEGADGILGRRRGQVVYQRGHESAPDGRAIKDIRNSGLC
jgi:hypothetical protein